jgi:hypothetical protein
MISTMKKPLAMYESYNIELAFEGTTFVSISLNNVSPL